MSAPRAILHVDMDAFYASVEQRDDPRLRGQPVIVGGTSNRGVVAAASYEVRKFGVRSAMPIREALRRCPHAICVKPRMSVYREVSHQVFAMFHEYTPIVEGLSLDEAFLDVTASLALKGDAVSIARGIKQAIRDVTHLAASVGVAPNKLVAKIASDLEKPDGLTVVTEENMHAVLDPRQRAPPARARPEVRRTRRGRRPRTLGNCASRRDTVLWPIFGRDSQRMRERASGQDDRPVMSEWDEKSISAEETFFSRPGRPCAHAGRGVAARRSRRRAHARAEPGDGLRTGEDPARGFHDVHAPEALRAFDHRLPHDREDRRRAADRLARGTAAREGALVRRGRESPARGGPDGPVRGQRAAATDRIRPPWTPPST